MEEKAIDHFEEKIIFNCKPSRYPTPFDQSSNRPNVTLPYSASRSIFNGPAVPVNFYGTISSRRERALPGSELLQAGNLNFDCRGALGTKGVKIDFFNFRNVAFLRKTLQKGTNQSNRKMFRRKLKQLENVDLAKLLINNAFHHLVIWVKQCLKRLSKIS